MVVEELDKMYSRNFTKNLKYLYIDLINEKYQLDIDQLLSFIELFNNNEDLIFVFNYNCLDYPQIDELINFLVINFREFVLKGETIEHIEKIESLKSIINEFRFKINPTIGADKFLNKITKTTNIFNYLIDMNKNNILNFGIDLYVNYKNIIVLKETLKYLSSNNFISKIMFEEFPLNSYYYVHNFSNKRIEDNYDVEVLLDDILKNNSLMISNRDDILYMLKNYMSNKCWMKYYPIQLCLNSEFKLSICNKIDISIDSNPFECFENGNIKESVFEIIKEKCRKYCLGCNCEDFIKEILER